MGTCHYEIHIYGKEKEVFFKNWLGVQNQNVIKQNESMSQNSSLIIKDKNNKQILNTENNLNPIPEREIPLDHYLSIQEYKLLISEKILNYIETHKLNYQQYFPSNVNVYKSNPKEFSNGNIYHGSWNVDGEMEGYGIYLIKDKNIVTEGIWKKGNMIYGRIFFPNDDIYEGEIENSQPHGTGIFYKANNEIYKGTFVEGEIDGKGTYIYSDKSFYCGEIKKGIFNGEGSMKWNDGTEYHGNFKNSYLNGKGKMFNNILKEKYVGNFDKNEFNGNGVYTYQNGDIYEGNFEYGMRKGKGVYTRNDNVIFDIIWNDDLPNGNGIVKYNGNQLKGSWRNGNFFGKKQIIKGNINNFNQIDLNFKQNKRLLQPNQLPHLAINDEKDSGQYIIGSQWSEI